MIRKLTAMAICLLMLCTVSAAAEENAAPADEFFNRAREALALISYGEIDQALETLAFSFDVESVQSEEDFRTFIDESFLMLDGGSVQLEVALCWLDGETGLWHLGIPLVEPVSWDVEVLVLDSHDLISFCGYSASNWAALEEAASLSSQAFWNIGYDPGETVLFAD